MRLQAVYHLQGQRRRSFARCFLFVTAYLYSIPTYSIRWIYFSSALLFSHPNDLPDDAKKKKWERMGSLRDMANHSWEKKVWCFFHLRLFAMHFCVSINITWNTIVLVFILVLSLIRKSPYTLTLKWVTWIIRWIAVQAVYSILLNVNLYIHFVWVCNALV